MTFWECSSWTDGSTPGVVAFLTREDQNCFSLYFTVLLFFPIPVKCTGRIVNFFCKTVTSFLCEGKCFSSWHHVSLVPANVQQHWCWEGAGSLRSENTGVVLMSVQTEIWSCIPGPGDAKQRHCSPFCLLLQMSDGCCVCAPPRELWLPCSSCTAACSFFYCAAKTQRGRQQTSGCRPQCTQ